MQNNTKILIGISAVAMLGGIGYLFWKNKKDDEAPIADASPSVTTPTGTTKSTTTVVKKTTSAPSAVAYKSNGSNSFKVMGIKDGKYVETGRTIPFVDRQVVGIKKGATPSGLYLQNRFGDILWASNDKITVA